MHSRAQEGLGAALQPLCLAPQSRYAATRALPAHSPQHPIVILIGLMHIFCSRWQNAQDCQAAKLPAKNTPQTHFRLGSLKKRRSKDILVAMEMTWNEAGEERKGKGHRENEVAQRLECCPWQVKARLSLRDVLVVPGGAEWRQKVFVLVLPTCDATNMAGKEGEPTGMSPSSAEDRQGPGIRERRTTVRAEGSPRDQREPTQSG